MDYIFSFTGNSCKHKYSPTARPSILIDKPIWTNEGVAWKTSAGDGKVGRYMSVTNKPKADNMPKNTMRKMKYLRPDSFV
ncbi:MAG: hypothetical protein NC127_06915 [Muribaculum sp.]|nr:hypothetical protein [Muribaculum sp.]